MILLAIPTYGKVSAGWAQNFHHFAVPLGNVVADVFDSRPNNIAEKRNYMIEKAVESGANTIVFLSDDVIPPNNFILTLLAHQRRGYEAVTGVYWTKQSPPQPYIFRDYLQGPYYDWKAGDFIKIDFAGCDCLMLDVAMLKRIGSPWFSLNYELLAQPPKANLPSGEKQSQSQTRTEDFFFYTKLKQNGVQLWCDTSIQCLHEDRDTGVSWGLTHEMAQFPGVTIAEKGLLVADIGCGNRPNPLAQANTVVRFDSDESCKPDMVCDIRSIPEADSTFDIALASHCLEHIPIADCESTLVEWLRILKLGGKLIIRVPDLAYACRRVIGQSPNVITQPEGWPRPYHHHMIYGMQIGSGQTHFNGFTKDTLSEITQSCLPGCEISIEETNPDPLGEMTELTMTVIKGAVSESPKLYESWADKSAITGEKE